MVWRPVNRRRNRARNQRRKRGTTYRVSFTGQTSSNSQSKKTPTCFWTSCSKAAFSWMDQHSSVLKALLEWANGIFILLWVNISLHCNVYTDSGLRFFFFFFFFLRNVNSRMPYFGSLKIVGGQKKNRSVKITLQQEINCKERLIWQGTT